MGRTWTTKKSADKWQIKVWQWGPWPSSFKPLPALAIAALREKSEPWTNLGRLIWSMIGPIAFFIRIKTKRRSKVLQVATHVKETIRWRGIFIPFIIFPSLKWSPHQSQSSLVYSSPICRKTTWLQIPRNLRKQISFPFLKKQRTNIKRFPNVMYRAQYPHHRPRIVRVSPSNRQQTLGVTIRYTPTP